jgi:acyl-CoA synthetase (AMP-forming)/AMP-acid ligase II
MTLLQQLEDASTAGSWLWLSDQDKPTNAADFWVTCGLTGGRLGERFEAGARIGLLLDSSAASLASLVGAWRAGLVPVSLPRPNRSDPASSRRLIEGAKQVFDIEAVFSAPDLCAPLECEPYPQPASRACDRWDSAAFVQHTSGSTGPPKGVALSLDAIRANSEQIWTALEHDNPVVCSWMPLSHDMGLMLAIATWAIGSMSNQNVGISLLEPESFMVSPLRWLRRCSEVRASVTGLSNQTMDLVTRRAARFPTLDLSSVKACIVGSEPIQPRTVRRFIEALSTSGFRETAICPAYGLAESTVAVTMTRLAQTWRTVRQEDIELEPVDDSNEYVLLGAPLRGNKVRIADEGDNGFGRVELQGPATMSGYIGGEVDQPFSRDGWLRTNDVGRLFEGELVLAGRSDDVLIVRGRNLHAASLEASLADVSGFDAGRFAVAADGARLIVLAEARQPTIEAAEQMYSGARHRLVRDHSIAPARLVLVGRGELPRTPNGKVQRKQINALLDCQPPSGSITVPLSDPHSSRDPLRMA